MENTIRFRMMTESEYAEYLSAAIGSYAQSLVKCGKATAENADEAAEKGFNDALPSGFHTSGASFYVAISGGEEVGYIWYLELPRSIAYIGDFEIYESYRKKGLGTLTLAALERELAAKGMRAAALNVFDFNTAARGLYCKLGFVETEIDQGFVQMVKRL